MLTNLWVIHKLIWGRDISIFNQSNKIPPCKQFLFHQKKESKKNTLILKVEKYKHMSDIDLVCFMGLFCGRVH